MKEQQSNRKGSTRQPSRKRIKQDYDNDFINDAEEDELVIEEETVPSFKSPVDESDEEAESDASQD